MRKTNKKGFTIVELVIVIAVIAILASILIPTFSGMIGTANDTRAQAEAKTLYSEYITDTVKEGETPLNNLLVAVVIDDNKYFFAVKNGQLDTESAWTVTDDTKTRDDFNTVKDEVDLDEGYAWADGLEEPAASGVVLPEKSTESAPETPADPDAGA